MASIPVRSVVVATAKEMSIEDPVLQTTVASAGEEAAAMAVDTVEIVDLLADHMVAEIQETLIMIEVATEATTDERKSR